MKDTSFAVDNLRTIRENIYAYATYAPNWPYGDLYEKVEAAQAAVDELINLIEENAD